MKSFLKLLAFFVMMLSMSVFATVIYKDIKLNQNCTGYLKRAADANTTERAKVELEKAIDYLENNDLTTGYTSILWKTPDEDVEFWYSNLKESYRELSAIDSASSLEKTNALMKLRETLLDAGEKRDSLTVPAGLSRYPNNAFWAVMMWLAGLALAGSAVWFLYILDI